MERDILYLGIIVVALVFGIMVYLPISIGWWNNWKYNERKKKLLEKTAIEKEKRITNLKAQLKQALEEIECAEILIKDQDQQINDLMIKNAQVERELNEKTEQTPEWYKERYLDFIEEIRVNKIANSLLEQQVKKQKADIEALSKKGKTIKIQLR